MRATVEKGPDLASVAISPVEPASIRAVERALLDAGVTGEALWKQRKVHLDIVDFARALGSFTAWDLQVAPEVASRLAAMEHQEEEIPRIKGIIRRMQEPGMADAFLGGAHDLGRLDEHQRQAVAVISHPGVTGLCLFDEQGLGKTVTTLFAFHRLREGEAVTRMLVVAPKNMVLEWKRDAERFFGETYHVQPILGRDWEKLRALDNRADIYVTNFETVVGLFTRLRQLLEAERGRGFLVVDESFFVKNAATHRARAVRRLRRSVERCLVLCGTPAPNSPHDIVEQFNIADGGVAFRGVRLPPERADARPIVQRVVNERGSFLRRLKAEVMPELPAKTFHRLLVALEPEQERAYVAAARDLIVDLQSVDDIEFKKRLASFMARRVALLQICSHPGSVVKGYSEVPAKHLALDVILENLIGRKGEKVIIWSFFTFSLEALLDRYGRYKPVRVDGHVADAAKRHEAVRRFQEDDETMLFIGNPAAAGAGLTLHRARYAIYESMSNQAAHYLQSLDRIHRRGQARPVEYIVLLGDGTTEERDYAKLLGKEQAAQELLGDAVAPPVSRESMLSDIIEAARSYDVGTDQGQADV